VLQPDLGFTLQKKKSLLNVSSLSACLGPLNIAKDEQIANSDS
jgi:hypothetical protein